MHGGPCTHADKEAFFTRKAATHFEGRFVFDVQLLVESVTFVNTRHIGLFEVLEPLDAVAQKGLNSNDANTWIELSKSPTDAHQGTRRAHCGHQVGHLPVGLLPDFNTSPVIMCIRVGRIVELVGEEILVWFLGRELIGELNGTVGAELGGCEQKLGAEGGEDFAALDTDALGHG